MDQLFTILLGCAGKYIITIYSLSIRLSAQEKDRVKRREEESNERIAVSKKCEMYLQFVKVKLPI